MKSFLFLFLFSTILLSNDIILKVDSRIPDIFTKGVKESLIKHYTIKAPSFTCSTNSCIKSYSEKHQIDVVVINVRGVGDLLYFTTKLFTAKDLTIKEYSFKASNESDLYNFGKEIGYKLEPTIIRKKRFVEKEINTKRESFTLGIITGVMIFGSAVNPPPSNGFYNELFLGIEFFLFQYINFEIQLGKEFTVGTNLFILPSKSFSPYIGLLYNGNAFYIPIGIQYLNHTGFIFSFAAGYLGGEYGYYYYEYEKWKSFFAVNLKLGFYF